MKTQNEEAEHNGNISRCPHDAKHPFTIISNVLVRNKDLTFESRGLLCYLLSHSLSWKTNQAHICRVQDIGKDKLKRIFKELINKGYVKIYYYRDKKGYRRVRYTFAETPTNKSKNTLTEENPTMANPPSIEEQHQASIGYSHLPTEENPAMANPPSIDEKSTKKIKEKFPTAGFPTLGFPHCLEDSFFKKTTTTTTIDNTRVEESAETAVACSSKKNSSQASDKETCSVATDAVCKVVVALFEKVDKKFGSYALSEAKDAIKIALKTYDEQTVLVAIQTMNFKSPESVGSWIKLFPFVCKSSIGKASRPEIDRSQRDLRISIAKAVSTLSSCGGCYTFDDKKLYVTSGSITKEYTFERNDDFWSKMEKFCRNESKRKI